MRSLLRWLFPWRRPATLAELLSRKPTNCRYEPAYPGAHTVVFTDHGGSAMVAHKNSEFCYKEWPHLMSECGEFEQNLTEDTQ